MAVKTRVIEVSAKDATDAQTAINAVLTANPIAITSYLEAIVIALKEKNQTALIVIFYDDGT
jgi:hypothetical protein